MEPMKKAWFCAAGGFKVLQQTDAGDWKKDYLQYLRSIAAEHQFNEEDLETQLRTDSSSAPWSDVQPAQPKDLSTKDVQPDQPEDAAPVDLDPFAFAKAQAPIIQLLPPGTFSKRFPYQCTICCSKKSPNGKVGELSEAKANTVKHFLQKHLLSTTHVNNLQKQKPILISENVKCEGLCISDASVAGHLYDYQAEFAMWCEFSNLEEHAKHEYWHAASESTWYVRSWNCQGKTFRVQSRGKQVCNNCLELGKAHSILRSVVRFCKKFYAAEMLAAKMFQGDDGIQETRDRIAAGAVYRNFRKTIDDVLTLDVHKLQQFVRASFISDCSPSAPLQRFMATVVIPATRTHASSIPGRLSETIKRFDAMIGSGIGSEQDMLRLHDKAGLVGGAWTSHSPMNAFLDLEQDIDLKQTVRSTQILEFIGFDASAKHKAPLSLCSLPIETSHTVGYQSSYRGNLYMAEVVGRLMQQSGGAILALVYDGILHDVSD
eukprot:symbB.v1.2.023553.t1/scaffold2162.1/size87430/2